jgi:hypothetical protein
MGKVARHTEAQHIAINQMRRCGSDRMKVNALTWGGLTNHEMVTVRSQQKP